MTGQRHCPIIITIISASHTATVRPRNHGWGCDEAGGILSADFTHKERGISDIRQLRCLWQGRGAIQQKPKGEGRRAIRRGLEGLGTKKRDKVNLRLGRLN